MKNSRPRHNIRQGRGRLRLLVIPTKQGLAEVAISDSAAATRVGQYWNAVRWFLDTGDGSKLRLFRKLQITNADGNRISFLTDLDELERLGAAGVLSFESIYARVR